MIIITVSKTILVLLLAYFILLNIFLISVITFNKISLAYIRKAPAQNGHGSKGLGQLALEFHGVSGHHVRNLRSLADVLVRDFHLRRIGTYRICHNVRSK